ncbi:MAG: hypothetical protein L0211_04520 [Planctomycetaceae bacterium]|nr:hypothetical protein [Planctomycetaceae bacterium]
MNRLVAGLLVLTICLLSFGCEPPKKVAKSGGPPSPPPPPGSAPPPEATPAPAAPTPAPQSAPLPPETKVGVFAGNLDDLARGPAAEAAQRDVAQPDDPNLERVKAGKGVGQKGRSLDQYEGVYVTPAKAYFAAKERIFFEIEFKANYDRWRVLEDQAPKDFDELKSKFLDPLGLTPKLPKLPDGHKYVWDAATEQLLVERPRKVQ